MDTADLLNTTTTPPQHVDLAKQSLLSSPLYISLIGGVLAITLYDIWYRNTDAFKKLRTIPGPPILPVIGNAHLLVGVTPTELVQKALGYMKQYGETISGCFFNIRLVFLTNPADVEIILNSSVHLEKSVEYKFFQPWFGDGLLISKGDHWRHHRKMIAPTFHQSILKSFVPTFVKHSQNVANRLEARFLGQEFDVHSHMSQTTVEILLSTAMGMKKLPEGKECVRYADAVVEMCDIIQKRQTKPHYHFDPIYRWTKLRQKCDNMMNIILNLTRNVVAQRRENFNLETDSVLDQQDALNEKAGKKAEGLRDDLDIIDEERDVGAKRRLALLDAMVEMTKNPNIEWTEKDVMDEVNTIMFEGHDTTSAGSSFVLCLLGIHKDVQARVFEEQKEIFADDLQRECTFADTLEMQYLERVIKETLRLYPPVPVIGRKVNEDVPLASGPYVIPKGTTVILGQYAVHRRPDCYENPEKFDPDNFLPEKMAKRHYYSYIPFSAGPRSCVGRKYAMLMLKVLLSTLVRKFHIHSNVDESQFNLQGDIILKLANGFKIVLTPREA
ncbi:cytochrome P450 4g1-like [Rhagoletis pomonella]|uniref:cytochrome P450 4g1-like n=1 Tax=Rhagoletis pomonella TaxID=28610 RepID=UPI00177FD3BE|nr:cytochrome P450 4g1-like [Rhagoletis pomonella]XP_036318646.1 cytochrome P450 4g1-like [Rhagoletis pomonella]